jgi:hypothetical protein
LELAQINYAVQLKYVVVESTSGHVLAFGLTREEADRDFLRRDVWYDGPPLETRRCSPALYRRLKTAQERDKFFMFRCRINRDGIAVCSKATGPYRPRG